MEVQTTKDVRVKMLRGMLDILVLKLLAEHSMHGYAIISYFRKRFGVYHGPSTVYPLLNMLEQKGYLKSSWIFPLKKYHRRSQVPRRVYSITEKGLALLQTSQTELRVIVQPLIEVEADAEGLSVVLK